MNGFNLPQHTQTPNELFDSMMATMSDAELRIVLVCVRKMFGWHKTIEAISLTQFEQLTGLSRSGVRKGIADALKHGHIKIVGKGKRGVHQYQLAIREEDTTVLPSSIVPGNNVAQSQGSSTKESIKEKEPAPDGAAASKPTQSQPTQPEAEPSSSPVPIPPGKPEEKSSRPRNAWYDAVQKIFGFHAGANGDYQKLLRGEATKKSYAEYNIEPGMTLDELQEWQMWYTGYDRMADGRYVKRDASKDICIIKSPTKLQSSIYEFREWKKNELKRRVDQNAGLRLAATNSRWSDVSTTPD